jgi:hypothetical protein
MNNEDKYRNSFYYLIIDSILIELHDRFSRACAAQMKADFYSLCNEIQVLDSMLKDLKLKNIVDLYFEIVLVKQIFPTLIYRVIATIIISVSSTTCESTFSKMKLIKTTTCNTMSIIRLSDLCLLAVEHDFNINFKKTYE